MFGRDDRFAFQIIHRLRHLPVFLAAVLGQFRQLVRVFLEFGFEHFDDVADILAGVRAAGGSIIDMALGKPDMEQVFVGIMNQN